MFAPGMMLSEELFTPGIMHSEVPGMVVQRPDHGTLADLQCSLCAHKHTNAAVPLIKRQINLRHD